RRLQRRARLRRDGAHGRALARICTADARSTARPRASGDPAGALQGVWIPAYAEMSGLSAFAARNFRPGTPFAAITVSACNAERKIFSMLIINNDDVARLLTMNDCIRVQEEAFKKLAYGGSIHRPRIDVYMPCERPDGYYRWGTMEGAN